MKFFTHSDRKINTNGTSLQGYIQRTQVQLEAVFGAPIVEDVDGQVTHRWEIEFADGTAATIYDWLGSDQYHVGGHARAAAWRVHDAVREVEGFAARAA